MSLALLTAPTSQFMFTRSPIGLMVTTTDRVTTAGVKYTRTVTFINYPTTDGVVFSITWNGITVTMTSMASPITEDGAHYRKRVGAEALSTWIDHFAEDIAFNYYIARDFDISHTGTTITFTAKQTGADYNISVYDMPGTLTTDYTLGAETLGVDEVPATNYRVLMHVYFATDDFVEQEMFLSAEGPDGAVDGYYESQIQTFIHRRMVSFFPELSNFDTIMYTNAFLLKYWLRYFAVTGATAIPGHYYLDDNDGEYYYGVMGGHYLQKSQDFLSDYETNIQFLTWQKRIKYVTFDQPEYLAWFIPNTDCILGNLRLVITYTDASTTTVNYPWMTTEIIGMYKAVGYRQIVEPNISGDKVVEKWTLQIIPTDEVIPFTGGETFTYYPITDGTPWVRYILFRNSLGFYDTLRSRGVVETALDVTGEVLNKWLIADYEQGDGEFENSEFENKLTYKITVGFEEEAAMIEYLREIFVNPRAAILTYDSIIAAYHPTPITINPASIKIRRDDEMLYSFEFDYTEAFNDTGVFEIIT